VHNKMGIHARPAAMIVRITNKFKAEVFVEKDEEQVNGKSIMGLMMLAAARARRSSLSPRATTHQTCSPRLKRCLPGNSTKPEVLLRKT